MRGTEDWTYVDLSLGDNLPGTATATYFFPESLSESIIQFQAAHQQYTASFTVGNRIPQLQVLGRGGGGIEGSGGRVIGVYPAVLPVLESTVGLQSWIPGSAGAYGGPSTVSAVQVLPMILDLTGLDRLDILTSGALAGDTQSVTLRYRWRRRPA